jgi:acylpyruvate hydrolase
MKLITFSQGGVTRIGALRTHDGAQRVIDFGRAAPGLPTSMLTLLQAGEAAMAQARQAVQSADPGDDLDLSQVALLAPIPNPGKIICIGLNYRDHAAESNLAIPNYPPVFSKYANTIIATGEAIRLPRLTDQVDYEAELAFVIGTRARNVPEARALDYIAGYVPFNDVSARDYQAHTSQWTIGKTFDTFGPMGPALVTADEVPDPAAIDLRLTIDGEVLQSSNTRNLIFPIPYLMCYLTSVMTLEPGDLVSTGTPAGVGMARNPRRYLKAGDTVVVEISGIGTLTNPVVAEA